MIAAIIATRPKTPPRDATTAMITVRLEEERPEALDTAMVCGEEDGEDGKGEIDILVGVGDGTGGSEVELSTCLWACRISKKLGWETTCGKD